MTHFIGIDIGGTKIAGGIVSSAGEVLHRRDEPTPVKAGGAAILSKSIALAEKLLEEAEKSGLKVDGIGIGAGGQIDSVNGLVFSATEVLPGWKGTRITEAFEQKFKIRSKVDNDVNLLALGEYRFGAARQLAVGGQSASKSEYQSDIQSGGGTEATIVFLALGTGVGGGLIVDGKLHHGSHWSGGEFGHILLSMDPDARFDTGGAQGTLEAYCSGPGLVATYLELNDLLSSDLTGEDVVAAAEDEKAQGITDGTGQQAIFLTGRYLGFGLTSLANALDPDLIIIGGGLSALGEQLLAPARAVLKEKALPGPAKCPVLPAALGQDAAVVGAAALVMD